jgi:heat-inducible transcriptional repressor
MYLSLEPLSASHQTALERDLHNALGGPGILRAIADHVHAKTRLATFYLPFHQSGIRLKHIHFERLDANRLLVLWVGRGGHTYQSVLPVPEHEMDRLLLERIENYFNQAFEGRNLAEIRGGITPSYGSRGDWDVLLTKSSLLADRLAEAVRDQEDLELMGMSALLEMPEFQDLAKVKIVFRLLERQARVRSLIHKAIAEPDPWILFFIGRELEDPELEDLAVVITQVQTRRELLGCVGAIGPKRLPYALAMQLLSHARETVMARAA